MEHTANSKRIPRLSIIVLAKNQGWRNFRAVASIIQLTNVEIIIIEPGSSDDSREIVSRISYLDSVKVFPVYEDDNGPAEGLNNGLNVATGEIIGYLNGDDFYLPGSLKYVQDLFGADHDLDLYLGSGIIVDERALSVKRQISTYPTNYRLALSALGGFTFFQQGMFWRKSSFPTAKFNENNNFAWDFEFLANLMSFQPKTLVDHSIVACFTLHDKSISGSGKFANVYDVWKFSFAKQLLNRNFRFYDYLFAIFFRIRKFITSRSY